jgi:hypothetical protein
MDKEFKYFYQKILLSSQIISVGSRDEKNRIRDPDPKD